MKLAAEDGSVEQEQNDGEASTPNDLTVHDEGNSAGDSEPTTKEDDGSNAHSSVDEEETPVKQRDGTVHDEGKSEGDLDPETKEDDGSNDYGSVDEEETPVKQRDGFIASVVCSSKKARKLSTDARLVQGSTSIFSPAPLRRNFVTTLFKRMKRFSVLLQRQGDPGWKSKPWRLGNRFFKQHCRCQTC